LQSVIETTIDYALENKERIGIWGGTSERLGGKRHCGGAPLQGKTGGLETLTIAQRLLESTKKGSARFTG
jgi:hypothetical protein